jgi:hypothetical protein
VAVAPAVALITTGVSDVMSRKTLEYGAVLACGLLVLAGLSASAQDKKDGQDTPALSGAWAQKGGEVRIEYSDRDVMKIAPHGDKVAFVIVCKYTIEKGGRVKARLSEIEASEELKDKVKDKLPAGLEFSFGWKVKADTATLGDVKGEKADLLKSHLEGEYEKK